VHGNAKVEKIGNEINTIGEGAKGPLISTWASIKEAGTSGITKGITEMGTTVIAMFIGKSLIQNGVTAVTANTAVQAVAGTAGVVVNTAPAVANGSITAAKVLLKPGEIVQDGKTIASTLGSTMRQFAIGATIAGAVVGTVAVGMSAYGAISASKVKNDYTTIEMLTDPSLAFTPKKGVPVMQSQEPPTAK
jgi:hypothetical protein